jgi:flagellar M-ring protein FliF
LDSLKNFLASLGVARLGLMAGVALAVIGGLAALSLQAAKPDLGILYANLEATEAKSITDQLRQSGVTFELSSDGSTIMADAAKLAELRMQFAAEGVGGTVGYELLDKQDALGTTAFLQNVNHLRAVEGELARTIKSLQPVAQARVHLSVPEKELFEQSVRQPSASITLQTKSRLSAGQVQAIRYLVANAVPDLDPNRISIVDQNGTLLARSGGGAEGLASDLQERQAGIEARLRDQITTMLERVVGPGKADVRVYAELETDQIRKESEEFDPEKQVVARQTTVESGEQNQDQDQGGAVSAATQIPGGAAQQNNGASSTSTANESSEQIDYQNSRTRTTLVRDSGTIKRLTVAVLVDGVYAQAADGKANYTPRAAEEINQIQSLVQNAMGFDSDRGDSVQVVNMRFAAAETEEIAASALPLGLEKDDLIDLAKLLVLGLIGVLALLLVVRPLMKRLSSGGAAPSSAGQAGPDGFLPGPAGQLALAPPADAKQEVAALIEKAAAGDDDAINMLRDARETGGKPLSIESEIDVAQIEGKVKSNAVKKVGEVVQRHPAESASIIRQWMYS